MPVTYRLMRTEPLAPTAPVLDDDQRRVVDHPGGPLLVLAGPGTGKTTTLVEAVVNRIERRGLDPSQVLVLTFGRKAAEELRDRVMSRLRRTTSTPLSSTFHSFCYALVRACQPADLYATPLRLLSSPEQDVRLRELIDGSQRLGTVAWPEDLAAAIATRGFSRELQAVISRSRELGLSPHQLADLGARSDRPEWVAAGHFMEEYLTVLDFEGTLDYSELVHRAVLLAESRDVQADLRRRFSAVFVDEYQDTDPGQVRMLRAIAGDGRDLVVVGDPDQSIYAFRGADVRGILGFPVQFPRADGAPAPVIALGTTRRFGSRLLRASRRIAAGIGVSGAIDADTFRRFRNPVAVADEVGPGHVDVLTFSSSGAEAEHIADLVRRAHLEDGLPWSEIAVLVRSGVLSIPALRRSLVAAGVPVHVAGDEVPLRAEPAVQPLLEALSAGLDPERMSVETAHLLVTSPLADVDAASLRRLTRELRRRLRESGERVVPSSAELVRQVLAEPTLLADVVDPAASSVRRLGILLAMVHHQLASGGPAEDALWALWQGTAWPRRLRAMAERGGAAGRAAHRDLDSVCALFEVAARAEEKQQHTSVQVFLEEIRAQQIPADTRSDATVTGDAVRLLTAHRSKGLEWRLVVVAGVQEGRWPDLRWRGSLLQADRLTPDGLAEPPGLAAMLAEERRLFYVAATRARERLVVTAVAAAEPDGEQPSRLLEALTKCPISVVGRPERTLSMAGLVAALRRTAADPAESEGMRLAAAARLARLSEERVGSRAVAPAADPASWWGLRERTHTEVPVRPAAEPLALSGSALGGLLECPLRWFLAKEAGGESPRSSAMGFGNVLHVLADHLASNDGVTEQQLLDLLDDAWPALPFETRWIAEREREAAKAAVRRLLSWHRSRRGRTVVATEAEFDTRVPLQGQPDVRLRGRIDRLETDAEGRVHVVDFKTAKNPPAGSSLHDNPQLGLYQLATDHGAFAGQVGEGAASGGAELVQLRVGSGAVEPGLVKGLGDLPKVQQQPPQRPDESGRQPIEVQLEAAVSTLREERFDALLGGHCTFCDFASLCPAQIRSGVLS